MFYKFARPCAALAVLFCALSPLAHAAAQLAFSPTSRNYPDTRVGDFTDLDFMLVNSGDAAATITGISVGAPFSVRPHACNSIPAAGPGGSGTCTFTVRFSPTTTGFPGPSSMVTAQSSDAAAPTPANVSGTALANLPGASDPVPGATLLFPYFEVDVANPSGANTILSWRAASATAILSHVTVWSDAGLPVLSFNAYLTGYDVVTLDMRSLLTQGRIPRTASAGQDPGNQISRKGQLSQDINFASCSGQLPYSDPVLIESFRADLISALTGGPFAAQGGRCMGFDHGDGIARGYVTVDTVNNCTQLTPRDPGYIQADLTFQNALSGEYILADPANDSAVLARAASIESGDFGAVAPGEYSFYGVFSAFTGADNREALPTTWAVDAQAEGTEVIVWRDHKRTNLNNFSCAVNYPTGLPLGQERVLTFDNEERAVDAAATAFPLVTQRVVLGSAALPSPAQPGWIYLGLGHVGAQANPPNDPLSAQAFVTVLKYTDTGQGSGADAHPLDTANNARHTHPN